MGDELAKKRSPSNVMQWTRKADERKAGIVNSSKKQIA